MKKTGLYSLIAVVLLWFASPLFREVVHPFVNIIASGRSQAKALMLILYGVLFGIAYLCYKKRLIITKTFSDKMAVYTFTSIIAAYILNFIMYVWIVISQGAPVFASSMLYGNGSFTSMQFLHSHSYKGAIAVFAQFFSDPTFGRVDSGMALLGTIPDGVFYGAFFLVLAVIAFIFFSSISVFSKAAELDRVKKASFILLFFVSSFIVIKTIFDGGILSFEAIAGLSFFTLLLFKESRFSKVFSSVLVSGYFILLMCLYYSDYFADVSRFGFQVFSTFGIMLLLSSFYALYRLGNIRLSWLILTLALIPAFTFAYYGYSPVTYGFTDIDQQSGAYVSSYNKLEGHGFNLVTTAGAIGVYRFLPTSDAFKVKDLISQTGFHSNLRPVAVPWVTCIPTSPYRTTEFTLFSPRELADPSYRKNPFELEGKFLGKRGVAYVYAMTIKVPPCLVAQPANFINEILSERLDRFSITGIEELDNDFGSHI